MSPVPNASRPTAIPPLRDVRAELRALTQPDKARFLAVYFKTGKGQYGEGDRFLGIVVPQVRKIARQFRLLALPDCRALLQSPYNEERLLALLVMVQHYASGNPAEEEAVFHQYLECRDRVNNWNLVDTSAPYIVGPHLLQRDRSLLYTLVESDGLWDRRIAMLASFAFIRNGEFVDTLQLAERLLNDPHDLMHKACGWMLREVGKRDADVLRTYLAAHIRELPRTALRYAIEKFDEPERREWLTK